MDPLVDRLHRFMQTPSVLVSSVALEVNSQKQDAFILKYLKAFCYQLLFLSFLLTTFFIEILSTFLPFLSVPPLTLQQAHSHRTMLFTKKALVASLALMQGAYSMLFTEASTNIAVYWSMSSTTINRTS